MYLLTGFLGNKYEILLEVTFWRQFCLVNFCQCSNIILLTNCFVLSQKIMYS